ncbi:hypothetical protein CR513_60695, partial [Mucuna pruriens]
MRLKKFNNSIIAILESNLRDDPSFFNSYPKFSMNIRNEKTNNTIKLYVKISNKIVDDTKIYRIYYNIIKIDYNYKTLRSSPKDETILVEANIRKSSIQIPKRLTHNEILLQSKKVYNIKVKGIIQEGANVRLRINKSSSLKILEPKIKYKGKHSKYSINGSTIKINLRGLDNTAPKISKPVYTSKFVAVTTTFFDNFTNIKHS